MEVREMSVSELRNKLSQILNEIERTGNEIIVSRTGGRTRRVGPVLRIVKYKPQPGDCELRFPDPDAKTP